MDESRLNRTAGKYGVELRFRDYREMLESVKLDAVYVVMGPVPTGHVFSTIDLAAPVDTSFKDLLVKGLEIKGG